MARGPRLPLGGRLRVHPAELVKVTGDQTHKFGAYAGMPREEFQWPMLARSFAWSRCVPDEVAASGGSG